MIQLHPFKNSFLLKKGMKYYSDPYLRENMIRLMMHENRRPPVI